MNAHSDPMAITVAAADLGDVAQVAELEAFVRARPDSTPFHRPAWVKAVAAGTGQRARYLVARDMAGRIVGVLPLTEVRSRLFGRALVSSGFAVGGGILAEQRPVADRLARQCWALAKTLSCTTAELRGGVNPIVDRRMRGEQAAAFVLDVLRGPLLHALRFVGQCHHKRREVLGQIIAAERFEHLLDRKLQRDVQPHNSL